MNSLAFDRTGTLIAAGEQQGTSVWDTRTGKATALQAPGDDVSSATFSRNGNLVLVTHAFTILDVTGERVAEGEMAIFTPQTDNRFALAGHLMAGGPPR